MPYRNETQPLGKKLLNLRREKKLTLKYMANETGLPAKDISLIEKGEKIPTVSNLLRLSRALEIDSSTLLQQQNKRRARRHVEDCRRRTEDYTYRTLSSGAMHRHIKAFKVFVDPKTEHIPVTYQHIGEEFQYVLKGTVEITVGENKNVLKPGDSLHFNSSVVHKLRNIGTEKAELLVVLYTP